MKKSKMILDYTVDIIYMVLILIDSVLLTQICSKYHIATHDVITYLCDREDNPEKYKVPTGFYIGKTGCSKRHPDKPATEIIRFNFTEPEKQGCTPYGESSPLDMMIC